MVSGVWSLSQEISVTIQFKMVQVLILKVFAGRGPEISDKFSRKFIKIVWHVSTCLNSQIQTAFSFTSPKGDSRCKSWKAEYRLSVDEGEVLEDAVGSIGVLDDAICCDTLFSSCKCGAHVCFLGILCHCILGEVATGQFVFVDVSRCERILPRSVEMRYRCVEP